MKRVLHCYAERSGDVWEAFCLDLDIAVHGPSLEAVVPDLRAAIELYLESVAALPETERPALLRRSAPLGLRFRFLWHALRSLIDDAMGSIARERADFTVAVAA